MALMLQRRGARARTAPSGRGRARGTAASAAPEMAATRIAIRQETLLVFF
jgi:hypothetical protein